MVRKPPEDLNQAVTPLLLVHKLGSVQAGDSGWWLDLGAEGGGVGCDWPGQAGAVHWCGMKCCPYGKGEEIWAGRVEEER